MKLKLTEQEHQTIEVTAIQNVMKKKFIEAVEKRMTEIEADLDSLDKEYSVEEVIKMYLPSAAIAVPTKTLLLPH